MSNEWRDEILDGAMNTIEFAQKAMRERFQLYGTIIHFFQLLDTADIVLPDIETLNEYGQEYYVTFMPDTETGKFHVSLKKRDNNDKEVLD